MGVAEIVTKQEARNREQETGNRKQEYEFLWIGTKHGPERAMVEREKIEFKSIPSGKMRRYASFKNFIDPFFILAGFFKSFFIILKYRPDLVVSAGSFVSVPVIWAAWILRVPSLIHQQDARPGLANVLTAPFAKVITVTFEKSLIDYGKKAVWIGNFLRPEFSQYYITPKEARERLNLHDNLPVVLILGGGTGALAINELIAAGLNELVKFCQIVHITGRDKSATEPRANYHPHEFVHIDGMIKAYAAADLVVSRCGMGVLTELSHLAKPSILIPMPESHQEDNALVFGREQAAVVLVQEDLTPARLAETIKKTLLDKELLERLSRNIRRVIKAGANEEIVKIIEHET